MAITIVCMGYIDADEVEHKCDKVLGTMISATDGVSHGLCRECNIKTHQVYDAWLKRQKAGKE